MATLPYECELWAGHTLTMSVDLGGGYVDAWTITVLDISLGGVRLRVDGPPAVKTDTKGQSFTIPGWDLR